MIDFVIDFVIDCKIDFVIDFLIDFVIDCIIDFLTDSPIIAPPPSGTLILSQTVFHPLLGVKYQCSVYFLVCYERYVVNVLLDLLQ